MNREKEEIQEVVEAEIELFQGSEPSATPLVKQGFAMEGLSLSSLKVIAGEIEERVEYLKKIQTALLKMAYQGDWVVFESVDVGGNKISKAELSWKGALRILRNFGVKMGSPKIYKVKEEHSDHYYYICEGSVEFMQSTFPIIAKASSKQAFWSVKNKEAVPLKDISEADIRIASYHEWLKAIPKICLGFGGIPTEELEQIGVPLTYARKITFTPKTYNKPKTYTKKDKAEAQDKEELTCEVCGVVITEKVAQYSQDKYGQKACLACQDKLRGGSGNEDV